jgi:hypothetical protein
MRESEPEKRRKPLIYIRLTNVQEHLYPHKGAFSEAPFFVARPVEGGAGYHHFAKVSTDSPNRKRKASRRKLLGGKKVGRDDLGFRKQDCHLFSPQYIVLLRFTPQ